MQESSRITVVQWLCVVWVSLDTGVQEKDLVCFRFRCNNVLFKERHAVMVMSCVQHVLGLFISRKCGVISPERNQRLVARERRQLYIFHQ